MSEPAFAADPRRAEILTIFSREVGVAPDRLRPEATLDALEIASLDIVQAIFAIEERFDVQIPVVPDRAGSEFTTVGQLLDHVVATLQRAAGKPLAGEGATGALAAGGIADGPATPAPGGGAAGPSSGKAAGTDGAA